MAATVVILLAIIAYLFYSLYRYKLQAINAGLEDERIIEEHKKEQKKSGKAIEVLSVTASVVLFAVFLLSLYARTSENYFLIKGIGSVHLVGSGSMAYKNETNSYLDENNLNNQFNTYDLIIIKEKPSQELLKMYDVVVYKNGNRQIVHRIVDIVEDDKNIKYVLRGDANNTNDAMPVAYEDIMGIYSGIRIPAVGIFVLFLQSPLGYITMGLVLFAEFIAPFFEKKLRAAEQQRLDGISLAEISDK